MFLTPIIILLSAILIAGNVKDSPKTPREIDARHHRGNKLKIYKIKLPGCRGFSINNAYYKSTFTRTRECRDWSYGIISALQSPVNLKQIELFKKEFDKSRDVIGIFLKFHIPIKTFYTLKDDVSRHSLDLSNVEKLLIDLIFDAKFGLHALDLDDKYIVQLVSEKVPSEGFQIDIGLKILKRLK